VVFAGAGGVNMASDSQKKINALMWRIALEKNLPLCYTILGYFHNKGNFLSNSADWARGNWGGVRNPCK
jgi:hypothetical protein